MKLAHEQLVLGTWFEDFVVGEMRVSPARTVTEGDVYTFAGLTGDNAQVHTDEEYGKNMLFGGRIAHGLLGLGLMQGLMARTNYTQGTGVASVAWDKIRFVAPIMIGDTIRTYWTIKEKRRSKSKPDVGLIVEYAELKNQDDKIVQTAEHVLMMRCRSQPSGIDNLDERLQGQDTLDSGQ